jgi:hypothetical protein
MRNPMNYYVYKALRAVLLVTISTAVLFGFMYVSRADHESRIPAPKSDEFYDFSEAAPKQVSARIRCYHPEAFTKHIVRARKLRVLAIKPNNNNGSMNIVYVNDHGEIYFVVRGMAITGTIADCIFAGLGDIKLGPDPTLKFKGTLPATPGPSGIIRRNAKPKFSPGTAG